LAIGVYEHDRASAGSVVGSAIAFRLFLFFIPMVLFLVGIAGFLGDLVTADDLDEAGITGSLAGNINTALNQDNTTRWVAVGAGLVGIASTGRTLTKALVQASCLAWGMPVSPKAPVRVIGAVVGLVVGLGLVSMVTNWLRHQLGFGVMSLSLFGALLAYTAGALVLGMLLPRRTADPGALLPGAFLVAVVVVTLQAVSQLYLPGRFDRASELYGAVGVSIVVLGWFFFLGRTIVLAMVVDVAVYDRFGSVSQLFFGLPMVRALPRRFGWIRRTFALDEPTQLPDR
jgi:uncharacterized BrkB/YihY/UPF0761 family membrane protein